MAVVSVGYEGTVDEAAWARLHASAGTNYIVEGINDLGVSGVAGTRIVQVGTGTAVGWGVRDTFTTATTLQCAPNTSGVDRWDTIVIRRDWGANATTLVMNSGPATQAATVAGPVPGSVAEQPVALVRVPNGATSLVGTTTVDLRQWHPHNRVGATGSYPSFPSRFETWTDDNGNSWMFNGQTWIGGSHYHRAFLASQFTFPTTGGNYWINLDTVATTVLEGGGVHDSTRLIAPVAGLYEVSAYQRFSAHLLQTHGSYLMVRKNSGNAAAGGQGVATIYHTPPANSDQYTIALPPLALRMVAGDYLQRFTACTMTGVILDGGDPATSMFSLKLIRG